MRLEGFGRPQARASSPAGSGSASRWPARWSNRPRVLLLDEPLGALDLKLREQMQVELKAIQREVGITFVFVTHDQEEALTMSDRIAVFNDGRIEQIGTPAEVYEHPATAFVAGFVGTSNLLDGRRRPGRPRPRRARSRSGPEKIACSLGDARTDVGRRRTPSARRGRRGRLRRPGDPLRGRPRRRRPRLTSPQQNQQTASTDVALRGATRRSG